MISCDRMLGIGPAAENTVNGPVSEKSSDMLEGELAS
jgi:hypothetical protein